MKLTSKFRLSCGELDIIVEMSTETEENFAAKANAQIHLKRLLEALLKVENVTSITPLPEVELGRILYSEF